MAKLHQHQGDGTGEIEADHPFHNLQIGLDLREPVLIGRYGFGRLSGLSLLRASILQSVIKFSDHRRHEWLRMQNRRTNCAGNGSMWARRGDLQVNWEL